MRVFNAKKQDEEWRCTSCGREVNDGPKHGEEGERQGENHVTPEQTLTEVQDEELYANLEAMTNYLLNIMIVTESWRNLLFYGKVHLMLEILPDCPQRRALKEKFEA